MRVIAANHPLKNDVHIGTAAEGSTVADIVERSQPDPILRQVCHVWIGDVPVARANWQHVKPKQNSVVTIKMVAAGGGGEGDKDPLRTILTIAVVAAAAFVAGPAGAAFFGSQFAAAAAGAAVTAGGMYLVDQIAPIRPPSIDARSGREGRDSPTLTIETARNQPKPFGVIPVVLGKHAQVPPLGAQYYTEALGDDEYLRMIVVWGYGPLKVENLRIGETPIGNFDGVRIETREGRAGDAPITLYPDTVFQNDLGIRLRQTESWTQRTTEPNTDEISVDVSFPSGLVRFNDQGGRQSRSVAAQIEYRAVGSGTWLTPSFTDTSVPSNWVSGSTITFTQRRTSAIRHGFRWDVPRGQYEVRLRRTSADTNDSQIADVTNWSALRSIRDEDPVGFKHPLCVTALSIKATDQLNGAVDQLTADVSSYVTNWDGSEIISSNPALLYRHVLQGVANERRLEDARVDLAYLEEWATFCDSQGFEFNMVRDFKTSVWVTLADIAAAGRGSPSQRNGKWSVVFDAPQTIPVQHFTPRNSWGFSSEKMFPDNPDAFRIRFNDRNQGWRQDERIVYSDGFDAGNAEVFETLDAVGITDPSHAWKYGRFNLAQALLRPEKWTLNVDFENLVARRGSLVRVTHDVLLVGLASGRISSLITNVSDEVTGFVSDEKLPMEAGKSYGVSIRTVNDAGYSRTVVTEVGEQNEVYFATALPTGHPVAAGDLFGFGEAGAETVEALVNSIMPQGDLIAQLVLIPYSPAVYDSDTGTIPPYNPGLTALREVPDVQITDVRTGAFALRLGSGNTLVPHINIQVETPADYQGLELEVQIRATGTEEPYTQATIAEKSGQSYLIGEVEQGLSYDLRVRWRDPDRIVPGMWSDIPNQSVTGQLDPPGALTGLNISVFGGSALLRWDRPSDLDVRSGGEIRFRHSMATNVDVVTWAESTSIGQASKGDDLIAVLPLKPGTYVARVFDRGGRPSTEVTAISTKQASVLTYAAVDSISEHPTFSGVKNNVIAIDDTLKIEATGDFDSIQDFDEISSLDSFGGIDIAGGTYRFAAAFDFGSVGKYRLTSVIDATSINVQDLIDDRSDNIDTWEDFDGTLQAQADCRVQVRHTDDDPTGTPTWSAWNALDSAEFEARAFEFRAILTTNDPAYNIRVDKLGVVAENLA